MNSIDQPLTYHDLLSPNIDTLLTISLQMSISSVSHSLTKTHLITQNTPILQLFKNSKTSGITYTYTPTLGWVTHSSNLSPVGPRSWWINFFITKIQTPPHFNTLNRSQTHLHHIPSPPTCEQYWSTSHLPWPTFTQHRYPPHNLTSNVNFLSLTFTDKNTLNYSKHPHFATFQKF